MQNAKSIKLSIIGMATLLILVIGATYAYLTAAITNDNGVTNIAGKTQAIGSISLSNPTSDLKLKVTAKDMLKDKLGIYYATNDSSLNYDTEEVQREIAVATLSGGDASIYYECSAKINIVADGTMLSYLDEGDLYVQFGGLLNNKIDLTNISSSGYLVTFNLNGTDTFTQSVTASVALENKSTDQSDLAGKSLSIDFENTDFSCNVLKTVDMTVNSNSNATLAAENSTGGNLIDYKIFGNSIQNGTPTPTSPVEVQSVGDRTKNLLDMNIFSGTGYHSYYTVTNNKITIKSNDGSAWASKTPIYLKPNTNYTISVENVSNIDVRTPENVRLASGNASSLSFTTDDTGVICLKLFNNEGIYPYEVGYIQIEENSSATSYEPYGYKIPITVRGKNILNSSVLLENGFELQEDGSYYVQNSGTPHKKILFSNDGNYKGQMTISLDIKYVLYNNIGGCLPIVYYTDGTHKSIFNIDNIKPTDYEKFVYTTDIGKIVDYISWTYGTGLTQTYVKNIQLELGDVATNYTPYVSPITTNIYLDEPLRKVENTSDYIDFETKQLVRNIKVEEITSSSNFVKYTWNNKVGVYIFNGLDGSYTRIPGLSNRNSVFTVDTNADTSMWLGVNNANHFWLGILTYLGFEDDDTSTAIKKLQDWLSQNPTYVYHATTSPSTLPISLPDIPTFEGTNIIEIGTTVAPSNVDIVYNKDLSK